MLTIFLTKCIVRVKSYFCGMKFFCSVTLLLLSTVSTFAQVQTSHYKIYSVARAREITLDDLAGDMNNADVLYYGEEHTDSIGHLVEYALLEKLAAKYPARVALSMEMFETDCQPVVNEYLKGLIREHNFLVDARAWRNYIDYKPLVEFAKNGKLDVIAANAPARYTNMATRLGLGSLSRLDAAGKAHLPPLPIDTATGRYYQKFVAVMGGHTNMQGMQIYQAQNLWDATMGWSVAQYLKVHAGCKVLEVNGGFHSEEKLGAMAQLKRYAPQAHAMNIAALSGTDISKPNWATYTKLADYIILTDSK
jgi:uncharacterized iron-regulated protein